MKEMCSKLKVILSPGEKGRLILLFLMMLTGGILEMVGVSLVLPMLGLITGEGGENMGQVSKLALILIIVYIVKNIFLTIMYAAIFRFVYNGATRLSSRMMEAYLKVDYAFHLKRNVADIQRAVCMDAENVYRMMKALLQLIAEGVICVVLAAYLLYTDLFMSLFLFILMGAVCGVFLVLSKRGAKRLGKEDLENRGRMDRWILQAFGGIKELKLLGREDFFLERVTEYRARSAVNNRKQQLLLQLPRLLVETVCIVGVMCIVISRVNAGSDLAMLIPKLGVFAVAAFRLLPSVGKVNSLTTEVLFFRASVDEVYKDLKELENTEYENDTAAEETVVTEWKERIEVKELDFLYGEGLPLILDKVNLNIPCGAAVGFVGPSGAGKTTLADLIMGLITPVSGSILVDGSDIRQNLRGWQKQIGYVPQSIYLSDDTIRNNVAFGVRAEEIDDERVWEALRRAQLEDFVKNSPEGLDIQVGDRGVRLSGGQRQRIGIARALYHDPCLLVFDEATSALDTETEEAVMQAIEALYGKKTMIIIAHRLSTLAKCDTIYRIDKGCIEETTI